jgi:hypothetical protein
MRPFLLGLFVLAPINVMAQPYSESMLECAALYQNSAQFVTSEQASERLLRAARLWADSAYDQSCAEGNPLDPISVWDRIDQKSAEWEAKGPALFFTEEYRDWMKYCRSFAHSRRLNLGT